MKESEKEEARQAAVRKAEEAEKLARARRQEARAKKEDAEREKREQAREQRRLERDQRERRLQERRERYVERSTCDRRTFIDCLSQRVRTHPLSERRVQFQTAYTQSYSQWSSYTRLDLGL